MNNDKFYGFYRGIVVDNVDPLRAGRVQVRVYPMFEGVVASHLPWAVMSDPFMGGLGNVGGTFIPEEDSHVFVFFENGDHRYPVYFGGAPAMENDTPDLPAESRNNGEYPANRVFRTKNGIVVEIDDTKDNERVRIFHPTGTQLLIDKNGYYVTVADGDCEFTVDGNMKASVTGNFTATIDGDSTTTVKGDMTASVDKGLSATVKKDASISADGNAELLANGGNVTLQASSNVDVTGGSQVSVSAPVIYLN